MRPRVLIALVFLFSSLTACAPPAPTSPPSDPVAELIHRFETDLAPALVIEGETRTPASLAERMEHHGVPALSVAVLHSGEIAWSRAYGQADVGSSNSATPETLFQAASISKPVAAMAALALVEEGRLDLDEDVNTKLTSWQVPENEFTGEEKVTLRRLLNHSAGTTVWGFPGYAKGSPLPDASEVLEGEGNTDPVRVYKKPGESWQYSGGGYTILQQLLVDISGESFPELMQKRVLEPLGMDRSTYEQPLPASRHGEAASGYRGDGSKVEGDWHIYPEMAAAGLWTTPSDLLRYAKGILEGHTGAADAVLSSSTVTEMLTPGDGDHGLGPGLGDDGKSFGHGGANAGFRCQLRVFLEGGQGAAVMTNSDNGGPLAHEVLLTLAREYGWPSPEPREKKVVKLTEKEIEARAGTYRVEEPSMDIRIDISGTRLFAHVPGNTPEEILPESPTIFFSREDGQELEFQVENGRVTGFTTRRLKAVRVSN